MLHIIWSVIVGFIVGLLARFFYPGAIHLGFIMTVLLGIGGSIVGGLIGSLISRPAAGAPFHPAGILMSIVGAVILLFCAKQLGYL
ncbi:MAG: GlsB/YeaQ/YmgE family stress response membrane protein [Gammaproteobacteria bacterium]|nr:MAG: GlsB/YeaQ/YmgE family stress response membrane protein [Gammaproteobacteria bacterium]